ncbi:peptidylprolyl isomerase [Herbaspirillum chlorophenolicum]|uniref:Peptidyl-prolyl cis-trans isomerase n=1 Tax=Herbaspirillum chlorophenolicum TaxID=211589 RepID=A0ABW8EYD0_9BURK|nr:peptidylprolyl isomerase [Herbaspirillum chlorophenolicum]
MMISRRSLLRGLAALSLSAALSAPAFAADAPRVLIKTSMGDIVVELNPQKAPVTVDNFLKYVKKGQYNGTLFHRVINGFMIQGGGYDQNMREKDTDAPIKNEANNGLKNEVYTIAMARTSAPHSATAQFFINVANNAPLDYPSRDGWGYAVFGKVVQGADVVDKIKQVPTGAGDVPRTPVVIESATLVK